MIKPYDCTAAFDAIAEAIGFRNAESLPWQWKLAIAEQLRAAERRGWDRGREAAKELYGSM